MPRVKNGRRASRPEEEDHEGRQGRASAPAASCTRPPRRPSSAAWRTPTATGARRRASSARSGSRASTPRRAMHGLSYSRLHGRRSRRAGVEVNRKVLADLAVRDADAFAAHRRSGQGRGRQGRQVRTARSQAVARGAGRHARPAPRPFPPSSQPDSRWPSPTRNRCSTRSAPASRRWRGSTPTPSRREQIAVLGRKSGALTALLTVARHAARRRSGAPSARPPTSCKQAFEAAFEARARRARRRAGPRRRARASTSPCRAARRWVGAEHPVTRGDRGDREIFHGLGFDRAIGPEAETEWYNFGALNFPADHPAMDMHDTSTSTCRRRRAPRRRQGGSLLARTPRRCRSASCSPARRRSGW